MALPSLTATSIAAARAVGLRDLHDPLAVNFLPGPQRRLAGALHRAVQSSASAEAAVNALTAGLAGHAALRMAAIDRAVGSAIGDGCRQVVVVGAGFDTRAWRLAVLADCLVVEVDLADVQRIKRGRLGDLAPQAVAVAFAPVDLSRDRLADALASTPHQPSRPTAWVWEAVAPYLPRRAVEETVTAIARLSAAGSRLAMTVAHPDLVGSGAVSAVLSPAARGLFAGIGGPLRSTFDDDEIDELLVAHGFLDPAVTGSDAWARGAGRAAPPDPWRAERLVAARR